MLDKIKNWLLRRFRSLFRNKIYVANSGLAKNLTRKGGLGFLRRRNTVEEDFLISLPYKDKTVYDIGCWEGITTIFFGSSVGNNGKVIAFEPNPESCSLISYNINLNKLRNVKLYEIALGSAAGEFELRIPRDATAEGRINNGSSTSADDNDNIKKVTIKVDTLDNLIDEYELPHPDFIKIDVESMEYEVLLGMNKTLATIKPALFIEMHFGNGPTVNPTVVSLVTYFKSLNYIIKHVEHDELIDNSNLMIAGSGHIYCYHPDSPYSSINLAGNSNEPL